MLLAEAETSYVGYGSIGALIVVVGMFLTALNQNTTALAINTRAIEKSVRDDK